MLEFKDTGVAFNITDFEANKVTRVALKQAVETRSEITLYIPTQGMNEAIQVAFRGFVAASSGVVVHKVDFVELGETTGLVSSEYLQATSLVTDEQLVSSADAARELAYQILRNGAATAHTTVRINGLPQANVFVLATSEVNTTEPEKVKAEVVEEKMPDWQTIDTSTEE